jgi:hypothetical protein
MPMHADPEAGCFSKERTQPDLATYKIQKKDYAQKPKAAKHTHFKPAHSCKDHRHNQQ